MRANRSIRVLRCSFSSGALGALLAVVISLAVSTPVLAEVRQAYVWADQPTAAVYAPNPLYVQPGGGEVRIVRSSAGRYTVRLGSILDRGGNIQVSSYGSDARSCQVVSWSPAGANVACFGASGAPADSRFSLLAVHAEGAGSVAYTWAGRPDTASYAPSPIYTYAPGGTARIDRIGVGMYMVTLSSAIVGSGANLHVTAYGSTPRHCSITSWGGGAAGVRCTNVSGGPADSAFSILALKPEAGDRNTGFLWADNPTAARYTPSSAYAYTPNGPASVQRAGTGRYVATLHGEIGNVQATAYGAPGVSCHPVLWGGGVAHVACFGPGGTPVDARFTVLAVRGTPAPPVSSCPATPAELTAGVYTLRLGNGKSLDAEGGGSFVDGTPLQGWDFHGGANQRWLITPAGGGRYLVRSAAVAKAVDAYYVCYRTAGCQVSTWRTNGGPTQLWTIEEVRGMHRLRLADGGMQLGLSGAIGANGARAQTGTAGCGAHQLWNLARVGDYRLVGRAEGVGRLMSIGVRLNNYTPVRHQFDGSGERAYFKPNDSNVTFNFGSLPYGPFPISLPVLEVGPDRMFKTYVNDWNSNRTAVAGESGRLKLTVGFEDADVEVITNCYNNFNCFVGEPRFDFRNTSMDVFIRPRFDAAAGRFTFDAETRFSTDISESGPCVNSFWAFLCNAFAPDRESLIRSEVVRTVDTNLAGGVGRAGLELMLNNLAGGTSLRSVTVGDDGELIFF